MVLALSKHILYFFNSNLFKVQISIKISIHLIFVTNLQERITCHSRISSNSCRAIVGTERSEYFSLWHLNNLRISYDTRKLKSINIDSVLINIFLILIFLV